MPLKSFCFFICLTTAVVNATVECDIVGSCKALCNGSLVDLSILLGNSLPLQIIDLANGNRSEESVFFLAPCKGYPCGNEGPESAVCQETDSEFVSLGLLNQTIWRFETSDPYRYTVTFSGGDGGRISTIKFVEDLSLQRTNSTYLNQYPSKHYNFKVSGPCVRPGSCDGSDSVKPIGIVGFVLLAIMALVILMYLGIGSVVMHMRGARGYELIPHIQFWKDLPRLVVDGCLFATSPCCCWEESAVASYHEIRPVSDSAL